MRIALLSDVHANLPALEAVLSAIKKHQPEAIYSLGDQVNLGPCPRETLALLRSEGVVCLHGNHERYIRSVMNGDPAYSGANFHSLRFNASLLREEEITFPAQLRVGPAILTHAMPGDDRFPVYRPDLALPLLRELRLPAGTHILCGHGHNPTSYAADGISVHSIGSVGCMDDCIPGAAPYTIADVEEDFIALRPFYTAYDTSRLPGLFRRSGMLDFCPIMARIACMEMTDNKEYLVRFAAMAQQISAGKGEAQISQSSWEETDRLFDWADGMTSSEFWKSA